MKPSAHSIKIVTFFNDKTMNFTALIIIALALGMIVGGILLLKKSAKKFNLSAEQLAKIKQRNKDLEQEESNDN